MKGGSRCTGHSSGGRGHLGPSASHPFTASVTLEGAREHLPDSGDESLSLHSFWWIVASWAVPIHPTTGPKGPPCPSSTTPIALCSEVNLYTVHFSETM